MMSQEEITKFYNQLRTLPRENFSDGGFAEKAKTLFAERGEGEITAQMYCLMGKIAHGASEEEFTGFVNTGELPAIELSASELEVLKGGGPWSGLGECIKAVFDAGYQLGYNLFH